MRTFQHTVAARAGGDADRVADRQRAALRETAGRWEDGRDTAEIIAEIEGARAARYHISRPKSTGNADGHPPADARTGRGHSEKTEEREILKTYGKPYTPLTSETRWTAQPPLY